MVRSRIVMVSLVVTLAFALAGCASDSDGAEDDPAPPDGGEQGTLDLNGSEGQVVPILAGLPAEFGYDVARIEADPGQRVGIVLTNLGQLDHQFSIPWAGFHLDAAPGETVSGAFIAPEPGEYSAGCYLPGHHAAGMSAVLVVA